MGQDATDTTHADSRYILHWICPMCPTEVVGTEQQGIAGCVKGAKKTVRTIPCDKRHGSSLSQHSSETADSLPCFGPDSTDRRATQKQRDQ